MRLGWLLDVRLKVQELVEVGEEEVVLVEAAQALEHVLEEALAQLGQLADDAHRPGFLRSKHARKKP